MERVPMDLDEAEILARAGHAGRVATALLVALDEARARVAELEAIERRAREVHNEPVPGPMADHRTWKFRVGAASYILRGGS